MPSDQDKADLVFVHLSDIHFRRGMVGDRHDQDKMLRNELQLDLRRLRTRLPRFDGLIISGDIAFGGKREEYEYAADWIETIRELLGCNHKGLMVILGNHDVDRDAIPDGSPVDLLHQEIRRADSIPQHDERLENEVRADCVVGELYSNLRQPT
jgi:predicted MPP superfamily phosphohydrolase